MLNLLTGTVAVSFGAPVPVCHLGCCGSGPGPGLPVGTASMHLWATTPSLYFSRMPDLLISAAGTVEVTVEPNSIYTLTTTAGQVCPCCIGCTRRLCVLYEVIHTICSSPAVFIRLPVLVPLFLTGQFRPANESAAIPASRRFPANYKDDFDNNTDQGVVKYFTDQGGSWNAAPAPQRPGMALMQVSLSALPCRDYAGRPSPPSPPCDCRVSSLALCAFPNPTQPNHGQCTGSR